jgi:hypothetical protein
MTDQKTIVYPYECNFTLADTANASFEVEIISSATTATTLISTPTSADFPPLIDNGSQDLGKGSSLRGTTYISSTLTCPAGEVEQIAVNFKVNGTVVVNHTNPTSVQDRPQITIKIKFLAP